MTTLSADLDRVDWLGRPMFCQVCGGGMDSSNRWQDDTGRGLVYGHELCLWPDGFAARIDGFGAGDA